MLSIDLKLTKKQEVILEVLSQPENYDKTYKELGKLSGCTPDYIYYCLKQPHFIQAIRLKGLGECLRAIIPITKRFSKDAIEKGLFMQGKTILEIGGLQGQQTPLVNVVINSNQTPSENLDNSIISKIIDVPSLPVDNSEAVK